MASSLLTQLASADDSILHRVLLDGTRASQLGLFDSAGAGTITQKNIETWNLNRPGDIFELIPGVVVMQASGEGKANQFFLRGMNLDHGTDLRSNLDDMPINQRSHSHGQGWTDLNFIIPELIARIDYKKGAFDARNGDFSSAGSADLFYSTQLPRAIVSTSLGELGYARVLLADTIESKGNQNARWLYAIESVHKNGPFLQPDHYQKRNGFLKFSQGYANNGASISLMASQAQWTASDAIPTRAVAQGLLKNAYDSMDTSDGGRSQRISLSGIWRRTTSDEATQMSAYLIKQNLALFSNFTYFLEEPIRGDQIAQPDDRITSGFKFQRTWHTHRNHSDISTDITLGTQVQDDHISNALNKTQERQVFATVRSDQIHESSVALYLQAHSRWNSWLRTQMGLRDDYYRFAVDSNRIENSGNSFAHRWSPHLNLIAETGSATELFASAGRGFHSNDARATTQHIDVTTGEPSTPSPGLVASRSFELGLRGEWQRGWLSSASLYRLDFDSELHFQGDRGSTEAGAASRRVGIEVTQQLQALSWLNLSLALAYAKARQFDGQNYAHYVSDAIEGVAQFSINIEKLGPWSSALHWRYVGPRPLNETNTVRAQAVASLNARIAYQFSKNWQLELEGFNLTNQNAAAAEYLYTSRLKNETSAQEDRHIHPADPRTLRLKLVYRF